MFEVYAGRGNLHLVLFPISIGHAPIKNHGDPWWNWDEGQLFDLIFVWGVSPKEKEILKINFRSPKLSQARQRLIRYTKSESMIQICSRNEFSIIDMFFF